MSARRRRDQRRRAAGARSRASSADFGANPRRGVRRWRCLVRHPAARALRAAGLAAEPLRPRAARHHGQPAAAGVAGADGGTFWLGTDDQGRDMLSAIFYGLRISLGVGVDRRRCSRCASGSPSASRRVLRRAGRDADHAHRRHPAVVPGDPDRARSCSRCSGRGSARSSPRWSPSQWAYYARTVRGAALVESARSTSRPRAASRCSPARIVLPPPAAELPAAADRRGDGAGGRGDRARGDAVVPRARAADHRAVARPADRQRLPVPAVGQVLDQLLPRHRARCCTIVGINLVADQLRDVLNPRLQTSDATRRAWPHRRRPVPLLEVAGCGPTSSPRPAW